MNLNQAQLGDTRGISLGGYIPAAQKRTSLLDQVLASIATSAVGAVAEQGVKGLMTPDTGKQAIAQDVQMAGLERNPETLKLEDKRNALQRWFAPNSPQQYQQALGQKQEFDQRQTALGQTAKFHEDDVTERGLDRTTATDRFNTTRTDKLSSDAAARELALKEYESADGARKAQLKLATTAQERSDPMHWSNLVVTPEKQAALDNSKANTRRLNAEATAMEDTTRRYGQPEIEKNLTAYLEATYPGNTQAQGLIKANMGGNIPTTREGMQALDVKLRADLAKDPKFAVYFNQGATPAPVVDNRPGAERLVDLVGDSGAAVQGGFDKVTYGLDRFFSTPQEIEAVRTAANYRNLGVQPPVMPSEIEVARRRAVLPPDRQAALKAAGY